MANQQKRNVPVIIVMFALFFMIAFVTNFAGSMGVIAKQQFNASDALSQLGSMANFIAYLVMGIPAGLILKRKGYKVTALTAVTIGFIGVGIQLISGYAASFGIYLLGAFVAGFSMCMLNIVVNPMLNTLGGGGNKGNQLIQLGGSCNSIGGTIAPILLGYLIGGSVENATVQDITLAMVIAMAIFALAFVIIALTKIPEPHMETAEEKAARLSGKLAKDPHSPLSFRHFVFGCAAIFFYVGVEVAIPNISNLYMSNHLAWVGPKVAGIAIGAYWFCMMCGRILGGAIGSKVSSRAMLTTVCITAMLFILCLMYIPENITLNVVYVGQIPVSMLFMILCGLCTSVMWGSIFNLATEGLGKYTAMASGIFMTLVCGGGIIPVFQGWIADKIHSYTLSYWVVFAGLAYILYYALIGHKVVNRDIKVD